VSRASELLGRLVAIDSVNPSLVPGGAGEAEIAAFVAAWLDDAGLTVQVEEVAAGRPNVVGTAPGSGNGPTLLLCAHLDTVGVVGMNAPFEPRIENGRLHGRGALDMKAGLAAIMLAGAAVSSRSLRGDVIVAAVCDEEHASIGAERLIETHWADAAILTEPTALEVQVAHKGFVWLEVVVEGRAAHGSRPDEGVDAIAKAGRILTGIEELDDRLRSGPSHGRLGTGSVHASLVQGGQELSSYPARCTIGLERRTIPGEDAGDVQRELEVIVAAARAADPTLRATVRTTFARGPFEIATDAPIVALVARHAQTVFGASTAWMDASLLAGAGIPTVVFGPGGEGLHGADEWVDLNSLETVVHVLSAVAGEYCGSTTV